jgi:uncharacterized membrane protein YdcZ (DUF606 family)
MSPSKLEGRVRLAGGLILTGLLVELATLFVTHSLSFTSFAILGIPLALAGMAIFFLSMAQRGG